MTREEAARVMGVSPREVSRVEETSHGVVVVMSSGAHRIIRDDGFYGTDNHPGNKHLRRFDLPKAEPDPDREPEREQSAPDAGSVPEGTVDEVLAWVGDDVGRALAALEHEKTRPQPRKSLIKRLEEL